MRAGYRVPQPLSSPVCMNPFEDMSLNVFDQEITSNWHNQWNIHYYVG